MYIYIYINVDVYVYVYIDIDVDVYVYLYLYFKSPLVRFLYRGLADRIQSGGGEGRGGEGEP